MLAAKMVSKFVGVYPVTRVFKTPNPEATYTTLLMSTGLTFGTISSLFGLSHGIITQAQYSILVAGVIGSAVIPTLIANAFYLASFVTARGGGRNHDGGRRIAAAAGFEQGRLMPGGFDVR